MSRNKIIGLGTILLAVAATMTVGCNKEKELQTQNLQLQQANDKLRQKNQGLEAELAKTSEDHAALAAKIQEKDRTISDLQAQIAQKPQVVQESVTVEGWESQTFGDKVTVGSDVLFLSGRATLTTQGKAALAKIAGDIKRAYAGLPVRVYGYTDSDPIKKSKKLWTDNLDLSANRAMAVTRYLIDRGVPADNIETIAMGKTHPVAGNNTTSGKAKNRRVEIYVIKQK